MTFAALLVHPVTIRTLTPGAKDDYGTPTTTHADTLVNGRLEQIQTTETVDGRDAVVTRWVLFLDPTVTVTATAQVIDANGNVFAVDGTPNIVYGLHAAHHLEVPLREVTG